MNNKPKCVVGFCSTTLISSKLLFDIEGIAINKLLESKSTSQVLKEEFCHFDRIFGNMIEILEIIEKIEEKI